MIPAVEREGLVRRSDLSLRNFADMLDGLVLQGGTDVSPETYGEAPMKPQWAGDRVRDLYEMELLDAFISAGKPVLGICRGCQLINVAFGGSLYQDIAMQVPGALKHHDENTYERQFHRVSLVRGTQLAGLFPQRTTASINSIHHQSVKTLGHDLEVEALAIPDGVVEAIRWKGPSYVFGMQWHPEFMVLNQWNDEQLDSQPILEDFLQAVRERKAR
jgi:putative glutamine amidotransferase